MQRDTAQSALDHFIAERRRAHEAAPVVAAARIELASARAGWTAASAAALEDAHAQSEYREALRQKAAMQKKIAELSRTTNDSAQITELARQALAYGQIASRIESDALTADPGVQWAKDRLNRANAIASRLDADFRVALLNDGGYRTTRASLDAARARVLSLEGRLASM